MVGVKSMFVLSEGVGRKVVKGCRLRVRCIRGGCNGKWGKGCRVGSKEWSSSGVG